MTTTPKPSALALTLLDLLNERDGLRIEGSEWVARDKMLQLALALDSGLAPIVEALEKIANPPNFPHQGSMRERSIWEDEEPGRSACATIARQALATLKGGE